MKRILFLIIVLLATGLYAQSPTAFRLLDQHPVEVFGNPIEPNAWAGAQLNYPLYGDKNAFDLSFNLIEKFVINVTEINLGRTWYLVTFGNIGLPNFNHVSVFGNTVSNDEGLNFGLQGFTTFGKIYKKALTASLIASTKINSFGGNQVVSYRFGFAVEGSLSDGGLPIVVNLTPSYILMDDKTKFAALQSEAVGRGVWMADASMIIPIGGKLGLLAQSTFSEAVKPLYRAGVIIATGL